MPQKRVIAKLRLPRKTVAFRNFANKPLPSFESIFMKNIKLDIFSFYCCKALGGGGGVGLFY